MFTALSQRFTLRNVRIFHKFVRVYGENTIMSSRRLAAVQLARALLYASSIYTKLGKLKSGRFVKKPDVQMEDSMEIFSTPRLAPFIEPDFVLTIRDTI